MEWTDNYEESTLKEKLKLKLSRFWVNLSTCKCIQFLCSCFMQTKYKRLTQYDDEQLDLEETF